MIINKKYIIIPLWLFTLWLAFQFGHKKGFEYGVHCVNGHVKFDNEIGDVLIKAEKELEKNTANNSPSSSISTNSPSPQSPSTNQLDKPTKP